MAKSCPLDPKRTSAPSIRRYPPASHRAQLKAHPAAQRSFSKTLQWPARRTISRTDERIRPETLRASFISTRGATPRWRMGASGGRCRGCTRSSDGDVGGHSARRQRRPLWLRSRAALVQAFLECLNARWSSRRWSCACRCRGSPAPVVQTKPSPDRPRSARVEQSKWRAPRRADRGARGSRRSQRFAHRRWTTTLAGSLEDPPPEAGVTKRRRPV